MRNGRSPIAEAKRLLRAKQYRGSGTPHRTLRRSWEPIVAVLGADCALCGHRIEPGSEWDLAHAEDRRFYLGPAHVRCNRATAANQKPLGRTSQPW